MSISLSNEVCGNVAELTRREWLVTNGIGGFAMGTVAGALTRRYHGLLIAAMRPPVGRTLLAAKLDEYVTIGDRTHRFFTNIWNTGIDAPSSVARLARFTITDGVPEWEFDLDGRRLIRRVWMIPRRNVTCVRYEIDRGASVKLSARAFANQRDYHQLTSAHDRRFDVSSLADGLAVHGDDGPTVEFRAVASGGHFSWIPDHTWYCDFHLPVEHARGFDFKEDHLSIGVCNTELSGGSVTIMIGADPFTSTDADASLAALRDAATSRVTSFENSRPKRGGAPKGSGSDATPDLIRALLSAADQFLVQRTTRSGDAGHSVIAGYPWFTDWGRDTMISLPGLTLATGRFELGREILLTWSEHVDRGMIPNRFTDAGEQPEYHTADATLWYVWAIAKYFDATRDTATLKTFFPIVRDIIAWHQRGTRHNIRTTDDGLLFAGEPGVNLTWMDAKVGDRVITPRIGKPVEINALWFNALSSAARMATELGESATEFESAANRAKISFARYWNAKRECLFDVLDGPAGDDGLLRPNQIFAVALDHSPLDDAQQRAVVAVCERELLTPVGLRSLGPREPDYAAHYRGGPTERDAAYHQGTVWGWLLGPFAIAHFRVHRDKNRAGELLAGMFDHITAGCVGSLSEIFDADEPHTPAGCPAQAWSAAETLRAWCQTQL